MKIGQKIINNFVVWWIFASLWCDHDFMASTAFFEAHKTWPYQLVTAKALRRNIFASPQAVPQHCDIFMWFISRLRMYGYRTRKVINTISIRWKKLIFFPFRSGGKILFQSARCPPMSFSFLLKEDPWKIKIRRMSFFILPSRNDAPYHSEITVRLKYSSDCDHKQEHGKEWE